MQISVYVLSQKNKQHMLKNSILIYEQFKHIQVFKLPNYKRINLMQNNSPKYRISYHYCKQRDHQTQKTNLVCLDQNCVQNSLICSFCLQDKHKGHATKPLKMFLQNLQQSYRKQGKSTTEADLEQLDHQKYYLLNSIKEAVQNLAEQFMKLQEQVIEKYQAIKTQILQKQTKRSRFASFYQGMAMEGKGDPTFQLRNYVYLKPSLSFNLGKDLQNFVKDAKGIFDNIKVGLTTKRKDNASIQSCQKIKQVQAECNNFVLPQTIKRNGNIFSQTVPNAKQTLVYLNTLLHEINGKIRIKIISLPVTGNLTLGIASFQNILDSKHQYPLKDNKMTCWLDSKGKSQKATYNHITSIQNQIVLDIFVKKNHCKIISKSNICDFILTDKQTSVFFFSMEGISTIQVTYPFTKNGFK